MSSVLIETSAVITGGANSRIIRRGCLWIEEGKIRAVGSREDVEKAVSGASASVQRLTFSDRVAIPGLIQTHLHLCQTGARGSADDLHLLDWLKFKIFPYENSLDAKSLRDSVRQGLVELLMSGTTCIQDMGTIRHTETIADELWASGIRAYFGKCLVDRNELYPSFQETTMKAMDEAEKLAASWHGRGGRIRYAWTPRFLLTCSDDLLKSAVRLLSEVQQTRIHSHASESPLEVETVRKMYGCENIEALDRLGILTDRTTLAHCVHVNEFEMALLAKKRTSVAHCPSSNLKLASGIADLVELKRFGVMLSLGCDGAACNNHLDLWQEMRLASLLQKPKYGAGALKAREAFEMATYGGAKALGWESEIGSLEEGKAADIVFTDLSSKGMPRSLTTDEEFYGALVYSGTREVVTDVMITGNWVVRDRALRSWWD